MKKTSLIYTFFLLGLLSIGSFAFAQVKTEIYGRFEASFKYSSHGNSFKNVSLTATFTGKDTSFTVSGFYDGNDTFKIRFMPNQTGSWSYVTASNQPELNRKKGTFECIAATGNNHGMVKVSNTYNFKYSDGKPYYPFGTTSYAWTQVEERLQEITLQTLQHSGFNKIRMCLLPKAYDLPNEEPRLYPFLLKEVKKDATGKEVKVWDFDHFDPLFFQHMEKRIDDLARLGIEADLILFHPYDKGKIGFEDMPNDVNIRYIKYVTARLSSFHNVWWSMANEFDLVRTRLRADWDMLSRTVVESDPYRHLCSIHGTTATYYEYWKPEFTHTSIQDEAPVHDFGSAAILRNAYYKPIIYDEVGYEGNLSQRWGRYSGQEMLFLIWQGVIAGTYVTHGESLTYKDDIETNFLQKGGELKGTSPQRIAFLRKLVEEGPGPLELSDISRDNRTSTAGNGYYIIYFGKEMPDTWLFNLPVKNSKFDKLKPGTRFKVEIIDTWEMTIQPYPVIFETGPVNDYRLYDKDLNKVRLPLKPYIALRITEIPK